MPKAIKLTAKMNKKNLNDKKHRQTSAPANATAGKAENRLCFNLLLCISSPPIRLMTYYIPNTLFLLHVFLKYKNFYICNFLCFKVFKYLGSKVICVSELCGIALII
jgi:hypothetical protein